MITINNNIITSKTRRNSVRYVNVLCCGWLLSLAAQLCVHSSSQCLLLSPHPLQILAAQLSVHSPPPSVCCPRLILCRLWQCSSLFTHLLPVFAALPSSLAFSEISISSVKCHSLSYSCSLCVSCSRPSPSPSLCRSSNGFCYILYNIVHC